MPLIASKLRFFTSAGDAAYELITHPNV